MSLVKEITDYSHHCVSCATSLCLRAPWMTRYRVLYWTRSGTQLSDVYTTRYDWESEEEKEYRNQSKLADKLGPWYVMHMKKPPKAFLIHEICWFLLSQHFEGEEIDLDRLFEVCKDIPPSGRPVFLYLAEYGRQLSLDNRFYPSKRPIIKGLRDAAKQFPKTPKANHSGSKSSVVLHSDCFNILPIEIRVQIASYLPTVDFLSLRQSSRAMVVVFGIQSFWKSRFSVNGDRGFLNCLAEGPRSYESKDWRLRYRCTAKIDWSYEHLWSKRRRWRNNRWLRERCSMFRASKEQVASNQKLLGELCWKEVSTRVRCDRDGRHGKKWRKCRTCHAKHNIFSQVALLESSITGLAVSVIREGAETYITGFDLLYADRRNLILGHRLPGHSVTIDLDEQLRGFTVIEGEAGIHALCPIFNNPSTAKWIGLPEGSDFCKSTELVLEQDVKAISGKFDHCKMIGLSIA